MTMSAPLFTTLPEFSSKIWEKSHLRFPREDFALEQGDGVKKPRYWLRALEKYQRCQKCCLWKFEVKAGRPHRCWLGERTKHKWENCPTANKNGIPPNHHICLLCFKLTWYQLMVVRLMPTRRGQKNRSSRKRTLRKKHGKNEQPQG